MTCFKLRNSGTNISIRIYIELVLLLIEGREETSKTDDFFFSTLSALL